jgi:hypothetical protein
MYSSFGARIKFKINPNPKMENYGYRYAYIVVEPIYYIGFVYLTLS